VSPGEVVPEAVEVERVAALAGLDADRRLELPVDPERHPHDAGEGPFVAVDEPEQGSSSRENRPRVGMLARLAGAVVLVRAAAHRLG
jgi:hypothetical protein